MIDAETRLDEHPDEHAGDHKDETRLWLRLLTCATMIESEIRSRLRRDFGVTLPRFDLMAQLEKAPDGMTLGALTGLVQSLLRDGMVERIAQPTDRRTTSVRLTTSGRASFAAMAAAHGAWLGAMFARVPAPDRAALMATLAALKTSVRADVKEP
ncbi:MAG: MarR family transcriptional regulator [Alphaproteobacteria bacterium]|nr:MarR family transcriptional regulator [Alphaproteobacteria bacterium]